MGRKSFYILSCGFAFFTLIFAFSNTPHAIPDTSTNSYVRNYKLFMQNKANFRKSQMNVRAYKTKKYVQMDTWSSGKNKANS
ncbi:MAG: hypothetical protein ACYS32_11925, partial [Planctomycetota bacterium]